MTEIILAVAIFFGWVEAPSQKMEYTKEQKCRAGAWNFFGPGHHPELYDPSTCVQWAIEGINPISRFGWREGMNGPDWRERGW